MFLHQIFNDSFFHADLHPGNIRIDVSDKDKPKIILFDCGIVGCLNRDDKVYLAENMLAFFNGDYYKVAINHINSGWVDKSSNVLELESCNTICL